MSLPFTVSEAVSGTTAPFSRAAGRDRGMAGVVSGIAPLPATHFTLDELKARSVCVDFQDGDFLVDRTTEGLSVSDHYLHKINGEAVE